MELKINSTIRKSICNALMYVDKKNEAFSSIRLKSNGNELYIYSTNGYILYTAGYGVSTEPLDVAIYGVVPDKLKQVDSVQIGTSKATFMRKGEPVLSADVEHNPVKRINFEEFFRDPGFTSFYTNKSDIKNALQEYSRSLVKRNNSVSLKMHISNNEVKLTSSEGMSFMLNASEVKGDYVVEVDALKLRNIIRALYDDVYIELIKPVYNTIIRIMSEEVWFALATSTTD